MTDHPSKSAQRAPTRLAAWAMGTRFELVLAGANDVHLRAAGEAALDEVAVLHQRYSAFARDSLITRINTARAPVPVDGETLDLLARAEALRVETGGVFDITIGRAMAALGHQRTPDAPASHTDAQRGPVLLDRVARTAFLAGEGASLDLGAIAKGFAIDAAVRVLRECDVRSAIVHAGGSTIAAIGVQHTGEPWTLSIPDPLGSLPPVCVALADAACSVSTTRGDPARPQPAHLIDPRTGEAADAAPLAAVVASTATDTDAWSTALCVLGDRPDAMPASHASILRPADTADWRIDTGSASRLATISTRAHNP